METYLIKWQLFSKTFLVILSTAYFIYIGTHEQGEMKRMESGHLVFLCLLSFFAAEQGRLRRRRRRQSNTIPTPKVALLYSPTFILYEMAVKASVTELHSIKFCIHYTFVWERCWRHAIRTCEFTQPLNKDERNVKPILYWKVAVSPI